MKLSQPLKILVGIATLWVVIYPLLMFVTWLMLMALVPLAGGRGNAPGPLFFLIFGIYMFIAIGGSLFRLVLQLFYLSHIILNRAGNDTARVLLGIGCVVLPLVALPFTYFLYVLPQRPPEWALSRPPAEAAA
ncbi:MAG: hypothetical protein KBH71_02380 [Anaerolineae bacterium]|nr:hypothetical protein [Anaerolineae bacterium]HOV47424.1 hypothetical protein [Anaerolineae bacterium]